MFLSEKHISIPEQFSSILNDSEEEFSCDLIVSLTERETEKKRKKKCLIN